MNPPDVNCRHELNAPAVMGEPIENEVMVIDLTTGVYFSLTAAGALAWPWLVAGATPAEIASARAATGDAAAIAVLAQRIAAFATRLRDENILRARSDDMLPDAIAIGESPQLPLDGEFVCERFDDMQAMLLADPVHEVGQRGWPDLADPAQK